MGLTLEERVERMKQTIDMFAVLIGKLRDIGCNIGSAWFTIIEDRESGIGQVFQFPAVEYASKMSQLVASAENINYEELYIAVHLERQGEEDDLCISIRDRYLFEAPSISGFMNNNVLRLFLHEEEIQRVEHGYGAHSLPVYRFDFVGYIMTIPKFIHPQIQAPISSQKSNNNYIPSGHDSLLGLAKGIY